MLPAKANDQEVTAGLLVLCIIHGGAAGRNQTDPSSPVLPLKGREISYISPFKGENERGMGFCYLGILGELCG